MTMHRYFRMLYKFSEKKMPPLKKKKNYAKFLKKIIDTTNRSKFSHVWSKFFKN